MIKIVADLSQRFDGCSLLREGDYYRGISHRQGSPLEGLVGEKRALIFSEVNRDNDALSLLVWKTENAMIE